MYKRVNLEPLVDRAFNLTDKYLSKAYETNSLIKSTMDTYQSSHQLDDGAHAKRKPRLTILGTFKNKENLAYHNIISKQLE